MAQKGNREQEREQEMENSKKPKDDDIELKLETLNKKLNRYIDPITGVPGYKPGNSDPAYDFKRSIFQQALHRTGCFIDGDMWRDDPGFYLSPENKKFNELKREYNKLSTPEGRLSPDYAKDYAILMSKHRDSLVNLNRELNKIYTGNLTLYQYLLK
jgi:hypothetical protein